MIRFDKVVKIVDTEYKKAKEISQKLNISELIAKILLNRGLESSEECQMFLEADIDRLNDPFLLKDMDKAVNRIKKAIDNRENIWIYGDYDVDGITSTSILKLFFKKLGIEVNYYIPDRLKEGYGLNKDAIDYIALNKGQLIITVDCGISSIKEINYCKEIGVDIIVTDHHQCPKDIPKALAVINPNREDCMYPFKKLAGVGVAFKLIQALSKELNIELDYNEILPIVATGTVADVVSLLGENRIIVKNGLKLMQKTTNKGIKALIDVTGLANKKISSGHIGFVLGPRINAAGRVGFASSGVELLTTDDEYKAKELAKKLNDENNKRQQIEAKILDEAEEIIKSDKNYHKEKVLVIASENWHSGVIGIVSSRITEKYYKPSILISIEDGEGKGSARSISSFNIYDALSRCKELFNTFGGHKQAAGLSISKDKINIFRNKINEIAENLMTEEDLIPEIEVDCEVSLDNITIKIIKDLEKLEPFGIDNPSPQFLCKDLIVKSIKQVGSQNKHLKMVVERDGKSIDCIGFNMGHYIKKIKVKDKIDVITAIEINDFSGVEKIQFNIKEIIEKNNTITKQSYYDSLKKTLFNNDIEIINKFNLSDIYFLNKEDRLCYLFNLLKNENDNLIFINNYLNLKIFLNELRLQGRDLLKRVSISYNSDKELKANSIVINPIINDINIKRYKKIVFFDFSFHNKVFFDIIEKFRDKNILILASRKDIDLNRKVLEGILPSVTELRIIYKSFLSKKNKVLKIDLDSYLDYLQNIPKISINKTKLELCLEVLRDCNLINYKIIDNVCYIKIHKKPKEKFNIMDTKKFKHLYKLKENTQIMSQILNNNLYC
ncbi:single-stranded-DNA-specific exonuclease RecJ [Thermohalobacter berrensis]|uniref:Single-stranded-DNA-specific exonuclease RecJ n=1 Tax=Thermohalobacter berrensis TaxID=99594 RepID=A0A419TB04_9FIRM|nr:single-stranded-DNA-specific exonuclease RecJ [Thermohalobacter berrensis]RKD34650.1 single-stranded-DNA-specific exonuclease RecJ [Thermohalobacter berrensis]